MIVDVFLYFNEKELLELRMKMLYDHVDRFIICDANRTHSGEFKEFTCKKTLEDLGIPFTKIDLIEVDLSVHDNGNSWEREITQRNAAKNFIKEDDICFIADCDEIINPKLIQLYVNFIKNNSNNILRVPLAFLSYRADLETCEENGSSKLWTSPFFCLKKQLDNYSINEIRESRAFDLNNIAYPDIFILENNKMIESGWHFSWMGSNKNRLNKYKSFSHYYDTINPEITLAPVLHHLKINDEKLIKEISSNWSANMYPLSQKETEEFIFSYQPREGETKDVLGRGNVLIKKYPIEKLPKEIFENKKIQNFLLPEENNE